MPFPKTAWLYYCFCTDKDTGDTVITLLHLETVKLVHRINRSYPLDRILSPVPAVSHKRPVTRHLITVGNRSLSGYFRRLCVDKTPLNAILKYDGQSPNKQKPDSDAARYGPRRFALCRRTCDPPSSLTVRTQRASSSIISRQ